MDTYRGSPYSSTDDGARSNEDDFGPDEWSSEDLIGQWLDSAEEDDWEYEAEEGPESVAEPEGY